MEDKLKDIFENVNNWLKFAEAKNATIVAGNGLLIFGICRLLKDTSINEWILYYIYFVIFIMLLSFVVALISFIPNVKLPHYLYNNKKSDNLLFFGSIMHYNEDSYLKELNESLGLNSEEYKTKKINKMYAQQIIINSQIAMKKYNIFNISLHLTLFAILTPIIYFILK